jgi:Primase C terminal 2 (PriCT-2)/Bifunctional DNA primase/polymerase, N-terminal/Protein of unknown function (DUF3987)
MAQSFFQRSAVRMHENGFPVIPIAAGQKYPGQYFGETWRPMSGWQKYAYEIPSEFQLSIWEGYPDGGVGIPTGNVVGIDIDIVEDPALAMQIDKLAREMLGDTPLTRIGKAPKRMLVYRCDKPFKTFKMHPLEVLAEGSQFVAYGIHPDTQQPYTWPIETPDDTDVSELPLITEEMAREWVVEAFKLVPIEMRPTRLAGDPDGAMHVSSGDMEGDFASIEEALGYITNNDLNYDDWIGTGMSIKGALGDAGEGLFSDWSDQSQKNDPAATDKAWKSLRPHSKGAGSIYYLAQQGGWVPSGELDLNPTKREIRENPVDFSGLMAGGGVTMSPAPKDECGELEHIKPLPRPENKVGKFPPHLLAQTDGLIADITGWINSSAIFPQPELVLMNTLVGLGAVYGRRYQSPLGTRTNIYCVGLAGTGSGKDHSRQQIKKLLHLSGLKHLIMGDRLISGSGIIDTLADSPSRIASTDEFGMLLKGIIDERAPSHYKDISKTLTELYSTSNGVYNGGEYSTGGGKVKTNSQTIIEPNMCLYGTTTPEQFYAALSSESVKSGELNRFVVVTSPEDHPDPQANPKDREPPQALVDRMRQSYEVKKSDSGNLVNVTGDTATDPIDVSWSESVGKRVHDIQMIQLGHLREKGEHSELWARLAENTIKLAMISAISANPAKPVITTDRVNWAFEIVEWSILNLIEAFGENVSESKHQKNTITVLDRLKRAKVNGLTRTEISKIRSMSLTERAQALTDVLASEEAYLIKWNITRPGERFLHADFVRDFLISKGLSEGGYELSKRAGGV